MRMRKKKHGDERISSLSELFIKEENLATIDYKDLYSKASDMRLEIGCGKGGFIRQVSRKEDSYNYIAVEKMSDVIIVACEKYATDRGLGKLDVHGGWITEEGNLYENGDVVPFTKEQKGNVRFLCGDANKICDELPEGIFESIFVNFCDPWEKKGYADRRLTSPTFLNKYLKLLKPGGYLKFKTDNVKLFDYSEETIPQNGFDVIFKTRDLHNSEYAANNIVTEYEKNFSDKGFTINYILAQKPVK